MENDEDEIDEALQVYLLFRSLVILLIDSVLSKFCMSVEV